MKLIHDPSEMQGLALRLRASGKSIGLVPTMGYLHEGHLSLCRIARDRSEVLVVSIFVNPTQFSPSEDLESYPRDLDRDLSLCEKEHVDIVYSPATDEVYHPDHSTWVHESSLADGLCGRSRPTHFRGVTTVVSKLFNTIQPCVAVFGQKDAQQARVIERMTRDLGFPVEIVVGPIVREPDGLAMSSRNMHLGPAQRESALCLSRSLALATELISKGELSAEVITNRMQELINNTPLAQADYVEVVDLQQLQPVEKVTGVCLVAVAVRVGEVRLIDNAILSTANGGQQVPWPRP